MKNGSRRRQMRGGFLVAPALPALICLIFYCDPVQIDWQQCGRRRIVLTGSATSVAETAMPQMLQNALLKVRLSWGARGC